MDVVLEMIATFLAFAIYGTDAKPRHPVWRNAVRMIAFGGAAIAIASLLSLLGNVEIPTIAVVIWGLCSVIVLLAEYELGSRRVAFASLFALVLLISVAVAKLDIF